MKLKFISILILIFQFAIAQNTTDSILKYQPIFIEKPNSLDNSFKKLADLKSNRNSSFVVFHLGDSHIQGAYFTGKIKNNLQAVFGASNWGLLFPYSLCKSYGPKILKSKTSGNWSFANILKNPEKIPISASGYVLKTEDVNATLSFTYKPDTKDSVEIYNKAFQVFIYHNKNGFKPVLTDSSSSDGISLDSSFKSNTMERSLINNYKAGNEFKIKLKATGVENNFIFHGLQFVEIPSSKITYHSLGVVGATFSQMAATGDFSVEYLKNMSPDLIVFSYGSNESYARDFDSAQYANAIAVYIDSLKSNLPQSSILITNTPDTRAQNRFPMHTQTINLVLKQIALEKNCAYWDLNAAMGGDNSILNWQHNNLALNDKLHFTKEGYGLQADLFTYALGKAFDDFTGNKNAENRFMLDSIENEINQKLSFNLTTNKNDSLAKIKPGLLNKKIKSNYHTVLKNDTLGKIAIMYGVSIKNLCKWNHLQPKSVLRIGKKLRVNSKP